MLWYLFTKSGAGHAHFICAEIAVDGYLIGLVSIQAWSVLDALPAITTKDSSHDSGSTLRRYGWLVWIKCIC